jgi:hypothetical protein
MLTSTKAILCRPDQLLEAAVALSCGPPNELIPLVVAVPPPISEAEYSRKYEKFKALYDRRRELVGLKILERVDVSALPSLQNVILKSRAVEDKLAEELDPYRAWFVRNINIAELLEAHGPYDVLALADVPFEELRPMPTGGAKRARGERMDLLPRANMLRWSEPEQCPDAPSSNQTQCRRLEHLIAVAWRFFRGNAPMPKDAIETPIGDLVHLLPALHRALQSGLPLKPMDTARKTESIANSAAGEPLAREGFQKEETVLIEIENDAALLLGVQYACLQGARLVCFRQTHLPSVKSAIARVEAKQQRAAKSLEYIVKHATRGLRNPDLDNASRAAVTHLEGSMALPKEARRYYKKSFLSHLRSWMTAGREEFLRDIEQCVSAAVPQQVVELVGDSALTVVTSGVPYQFVRRDAVNWASKPIGHITGDVQLLLYREIFSGRNSGTGVAFDLMFDHGDFPEETADILRTIKGRTSHPITLSGEDSNQDALIVLPSFLPIELIYLNTHGFDSGIVLSEGPIKGFRLGQRLVMPQKMRTVVFNNSCISMQGMGREFIRGGAGTYVGTLWSVDAEDARRYAQRVVNRMIVDQQPISVCLAGERSTATCLAYILVGSARRALHSGSPHRSEDSAERMILTARLLLQAANEFAKRTDYSVNRWEQSLAALLLLEVEKCTERALIEEKKPDPVGHIEMLLLKAEFFERSGSPEDLSKFVLLSKEIAVLLESIESEKDTSSALHIAWKRVQARFYVKTEQHERAKATYGELTKLLEAGGTDSAAYAEISDFQKMNGNYDEALKYAIQSFEASHSKPDVVDRLRAQTLNLGRVVQARIRKGQLDLAINDARRGFDLATQLDDEAEQYEFSSDIARIYLRQKKFQEAAASIELCHNLAVRAHDVRLDLNATGMRAILALAQKDWETAKNAIERGLTRSQSLNFLGIHADFHVDAAQVWAATGMLDRANFHLRIAHDIFSRRGEFEKMRTVSLMMMRLSESVPPMAPLE